MKVNLTPDQERMVQDELNSGHFRTAEEVIAEALQVLWSKTHNANDANGKESQRSAVREMLDFVRTHRVRLDGISVKELIHEGHRL